jgi:hypothetical protein
LGSSTGAVLIRAAYASRSAYDRRLGVDATAGRSAA